MMKNKKYIPYLVLILLLYGFLIFANRTFDPYKIRIINLCFVYVVLAISLNIINGFAGLFSLGHAGFMALGAYTSAILTMTPAGKAATYYMIPITPILANVQLSFPLALLVAGAVTAFFGFLIGFPVLKLRDDYLAIASLGFAEILRVVFNNTYTITNGSLGLNGIPIHTTLLVSATVAVIVIFLTARLMQSSFGRAIKSVRDDEIAAEAMGIDLFKTKLLAFVVGSFFAGVGGAMLGNLIGTIDPNLFKFTLTFNILLIVVLGGMGSISGSVIAAVIVTVMMESLRFLDESFSFIGYRISGVQGLRMVIFSILLMIVVIFYREGLMGKNELSMAYIKDKINRLKNKGKKTRKEVG